MLKSILTVLCCLIISYINAQQKTDIYLFPGQGSDCRIFSKLEFDTTKYDVYCFDYGVPPKNESLSDFAMRLSEEIDTTRSFVLIGVSLGGMFCTEIAHVLSPEKTIIISSAKTMSELPKKYTIQRKYALYKIIPDRWYKKGALFLQPIVEPDRRNEKETFVSMLNGKSPLYFNRTVEMLIHWNRTSCSESVIHIHGSKDNTIPIDGLSTNYVIEEGSHMMTLTRANEINTLLKELLN
jgi:pimeloyl-ACP methyl ester carboxylesterase